MIDGRGAALTALILAGCAFPGADPASQPRAGISLSPDLAGLAVNGSAQRIDFGRSPKGVIPVLDR